jgi:hypothetical protein
MILLEQSISRNYVPSSYVFIVNLLNPLTIQSMLPLIVQKYKPDSLAQWPL